MIYCSVQLFKMDYRLGLITWAELPLITLVFIVGGPAFERFQVILLNLTAMLNRIYIEVLNGFLVVQDNSAINTEMERLCMFQNPLIAISYKFAFLQSKIAVFSQFLMGILKTIKILVAGSMVYKSNTFTLGSLQAAMQYGEIFVGGSGAFNALRLANLKDLRNLLLFCFRNTLLKSKSYQRLTTTALKWTIFLFRLAMFLSHILQIQL